MGNGAKNRSCKRCGKPLNSYNKTGKCYSHTIGEVQIVRRERASDAFAKNTTPNVAVALEPPVKTLKPFKKERPIDRKIVAAVLFHYNVLEPDVRSTRRMPQLIKARFVLCYLLKEHTELINSRIVQILGRLDKTMILYARNSIHAHFATYAADLAAIRGYCDIEQPPGTFEYLEQLQQEKLKPQKQAAE